MQKASDLANPDEDVHVLHGLIASCKQVMDSREESHKQNHDRTTIFP